MLQKIRYFLFLLTVLLVIVVAFQNHDPVSIKLLAFQGEYPLTLLLLSTAVISFVLGSIVTAWRARKREKAKLRQQQASRSASKDGTKSKSASPLSSEPSTEKSPLET